MASDHQSRSAHNPLARTRPPVGREREQDLLRAAIESARSGEGGLSMISGEAGIGKTTLLQWGIDLARSLETPVFSAHCLDTSTPPPYAPWLALSGQIRSAERDDSSLPDLADIESRDAIWEMVERTIARAAETEAVILTIEDVHWADESSIHLLGYLVRLFQSSPVLFIITFREDEITSSKESHRTLLDLARLPRTWRTQLQRLDRRGSRMLMRQISELPEADEERLVDYLVDRCDGNPFFAVETLHMLIERRLLDPGPPPTLAADFDLDIIPDLVQHVVSHRLDTFPLGTRNLLELASVAGNAVSFDLLEHIFTSELEELDEAIQEATARGALRESDDRLSVRFSHELFRQTVYASISPLRRRRIHRQIGEKIAESRKPDPDVVAEHFSLAGDERALLWLARAARQAQQLHSPEGALARCEQALSFARTIAIDPPVEIYRVQGAACDTLGEIEEARESLNQALALATRTGNRQERWNTLLDLSKMWAASDYTLTLRYVNEALDEARRIGDQPIIAATLNQLGNTYANVEEFDEAIAAHNAALEIFRELGDQHGEALTRDLLGLALLLQGDAARSVEHYDQAIPVLRNLNDRRTLSSSLATASVSRHGAEHILYSTSMERRLPADQHARYAQLEEAIDHASDIGWRAGEAYALAMRSWVAHVYGDLDVALRDGRSSDEIARRIGHPQWRIIALCSIGNLALDAGNPAEATRSLETAWGLARPTGSRFMIGLATSMLAAAMVAADRIESARDILGPSIDLATEPATQSQRNLWAAYVKLCLKQGNIDEACRQMDRLDTTMPGAPRDRHPGTQLLRATVLRHANEFEQADELLATAQDTCERFGYRTLLLSIIRERCRVALETGGIAESEHLRAQWSQLVASLAERLDTIDPALAGSMLRRDSAIFGSARPFQANRVPANDEQLTPRERDVLQLVAIGLTDAETAMRLSISPRTVSQHLRSIYARLDVSNRTAAVRVARERHLLPDTHQPAG